MKKVFLVLVIGMVCMVIAGVALGQGKKQEKPIFSEAEKKADELVYKLKCGDLGDKFAAASELAKIGEPAVRFLIHALKDGDECVRSYAVEVLEAIGDKRAIPHLKKIWKEDENKVNQVFAASALVKIDNNEDAYQFLITALKDEDEYVCSYAVEALGKIKDKRAVPHLKKVWKEDKSKETQVCAAFALVSIENNKDAHKFLVDALKDKDKNVRFAAAVELGEIGDKQAVEPLLKFLEDEDLNVCIYAAETLEKIGDERAIEPLVEILKGRNEDEDFRRLAREALVKIGSKKAAESLIKAMKKDNSSSVVRHAIPALIKIGKPAVEPLIEALKDKGQSVGIAAMILGTIGDKRTVSHLKKVWKEDKSKENQVCAAFALVRIESNKDAYKFLIEISEDRSSSAHYSAKGALEEIRSGYTMWDKMWDK